MTRSLSRRHPLAELRAGRRSRILSAAPGRAKVRHAVIGCGGMGGSDMGQIAAIPTSRSSRSATSTRRPSEGPPRNSRREDVPRHRKMFAEIADEIDTVNVGTPDHMHAAASMSALNRGKHVYCQKPLTHDVYEARRLAEVARQKKLVTQMGIQVHSSKEYRLAVRVVQDGAIGKVKEVHSWSSKKWGSTAPGPRARIRRRRPLDWDLWLGTAPLRPYKKGLYHTANWRKSGPTSAAGRWATCRSTSSTRSPEICS
jgi:predicted dehydrogenase